MNEKMNETMTLDDLIQRGVAIREQRIAEEKAQFAAFREELARLQAEDVRAILALLPAPLDEFAMLDIGANYADVCIQGPFKGAGRVKLVAFKADGQWFFIEYAAYNPDGYYLKFQTLEEAVAYAAGALEI